MCYIVDELILQQALFSGENTVLTICFKQHALSHKSHHSISIPLSTHHSYTLIPARFPRIEGASGNVSEHHTSRSSWLLSRTDPGKWPEKTWNVMFVQHFYTWLVVDILHTRSSILKSRTLNTQPCAFSQHMTRYIGVVAVALSVSTFATRITSAPGSRTTWMSGELLREVCGLNLDTWHRIVVISCFNILPPKVTHLGWLLKREKQQKREENKKEECERILSCGRKWIVCDD